MARVRFPFIVRKTRNGNGEVKFAKEGVDDFNWVYDQLEATVYNSSKEFSAYWDMSATKQLKLCMRGYDILREDNHLWEFIYVG